MTKTRVLSLICLPILAVVQLLGPVPAEAGAPAQDAKEGRQQPSAPALSAYAPGRIVVQFSSDVSRTAKFGMLGTYGVKVEREIVPGTYAISVPAGREQALVQELRADPAIESAMLDWRLDMPAVHPLGEPAPGAGESWDGPSLAPISGGVITDSLRMSATPGGPALPDNTLPTETPLVYAVFDYAGLSDEPVRVQVYAVDIETAPIVVFDAINVLSGSGTESVVVPAYDYFVDSGTFPIGRYLTLVYKSVGGSWQPIGTVSWHVSTQPNDRWFLSNRYQWNLHNTGIMGTTDADIDAPEAWDVTTGSDRATVAVISTGVSMNHPDLVNKIWKNQGEVPGNGLDDDGNGYVDDVSGYEFFLDEDNPDPTDDIGWGTFAAGIIAAESNNQIGMAGVSWGARIMPIKVVRLYVTSTSQVPYGYVSDLIQGLHYAADNGAQVIFVAPVVSSDEFDKVETLRQAVEYATAKGSLIIGIVGDQGRDDAVWPALFSEVLGVGATDYNDELTDFSNFGEALEDGLVAPGKLVLSTCMSYLPACVSTYPQDRHGQTAWAAAHVAGTASLVWSVNSELSPAEVRQRLVETADDLGPAGPDQLYGYGRLNASRAVRRTRHLLRLDISDLYFLVDDQDSQVCRLISNPATGPFSWSASQETEWLRVHGPIGAFTPSRLEVCVVRSALGDYGTYTTTLKILSTIDTQTEPVSIPVTAEYVPHKSRALLPLLTR